MAEQALRERLRRIFSFTLDNPAILGVLLYGSYATGGNTCRSDVDICIVTSDISDYDAWSYVIQNLGGEAEDKFDVRVFNELPIQIQGQILDKGIVIVSPDVPALYERLFPARKQWDDWKYRMAHCVN
nr:nucleotidyltransferase domain-containing protein [Candidatus Sigynarchaeum springense]MDO8117132.1 nucleotidyltransferase domain-containing protein [Candidatus Sigynarchaeota archaeon]